MTTHFYTNSTGRTVSASRIKAEALINECAMAVIYSHAQRVLSDDETPPVATPALPPMIYEVSKWV